VDDRVSGATLLNQLRQQGVELTAQGDQLRASMEGFVATPSLRSLLGDRKAELLRALREEAFRKQVAAWQVANAARLRQEDDPALGSKRIRHGEAGHDVGGYCTEHRRPLSYPEQKRGACSWCVEVDRDLEPEYWESHWSRFSRQKESK
jgi:hypothetical protein